MLLLYYEQCEHCIEWSFLYEDRCRRDEILHSFLFNDRWVDFITKAYEYGDLYIKVRVGNK